MRLQIVALFALPFLTASAYGMNACEFFLSDRYSLTDRMGIRSTGDGEIVPTFKPNGIVLQHDSNIYISKAGVIGKAQIPQELASYELRETTDDLVWMVLHDVINQRKVLLNSRTQKVVKSYEGADYWNIQLHVSGNHTLIELDYTLTKIRVFDLNKSTVQPIATGVFRPEQHIVKEAGFEDANSAEMITWTVHYDETMGILHMIPEGRIKERRVIRYTRLDQTLRPGPSFLLPLNADFVRFSSNDFLDFVTIDSEAEIQRVYLPTGKSILRLPLPQGFMPHDFAIHPGGHLVAVIGRTDFQLPLLIARVDSRAPQILYQGGIQQLVTAGNNRDIPIIYQMSWVGAKQLNLIIDSYGSVTLEMK